MHAGRLLLPVRQYIDMRLAGAQGWKRATAAVLPVLAALALVVIGPLSGHYALAAAGAVLAAGTIRQGTDGDPR